MDDAQNTPEPDETKQPRQVVRKPAEDLRVIYTNSVLVAYSLYDIVFDFGQIEESSDTKIVTKDLVKVFMSPQHAKVLARVLNERIEKYENRFGPISVQEKQAQESNKSS